MTHKKPQVFLPEAEGGAEAGGLGFLLSHYRARLQMACNSQVLLRNSILIKGHKDMPVVVF